MMTREEYQKLAQNSEIMKSIDPELQKIITLATGESMEQYALILTQSRDIIEKAKKDMVQKNNEVVEKFVEKVKEIQKTKNKAQEEATRKEEQKDEMALLEELEKV